VGRYRKWKPDTVPYYQIERNKFSFTFLVYRVLQRYVWVPVPFAFIFVTGMTVFHLSLDLDRNAAKETFIDIRV
jgi:hypothetical protein